jgi:hypothetical protein
MSGQLHAPPALPPGKGPLGTHWLGGWVGPRPSLDMVVKIQNIEHPAHSSALYHWAIWALTADIVLMNKYIHEITESTYLYYYIYVNKQMYV